MCSLLECCFISSKDDIKKFNSNIDAIAKGILNAFDIGASTPNSPKQVPGTAKNNKGLGYAVHCQTLGWCSSVKDGQTRGTTGHSKRVEAFKFTSFPSNVARVDVEISLSKERLDGCRQEWCHRWNYWAIIASGSYSYLDVVKRGVICAPFSCLP